MNDRVLIGLVVVAVGASVLMLATGSIPVLKIALIVSLWAALVGAFMVARLKQKIGDLEQEHEESETLAADTLAQIRAQLDAMAAQLEDLSGQMMPTQPTLRAEATRVTELPAPKHVRGGDSGPSLWVAQGFDTERDLSAARGVGAARDSDAVRGFSAARDFGAARGMFTGGAGAAAFVGAADAGAGSFVGAADDTDVELQATSESEAQSNQTQDNQAQTPDSEDRAPREERVEAAAQGADVEPGVDPHGVEAPVAGAQAAEVCEATEVDDEPVVEPEIEPEREHSFAAGDSSAAGGSTLSGRDASRTGEFDVEPEHTGRRRADEHSDGISVAELLARHRK